MNTMQSTMTGTPKQAVMSVPLMFLLAAAPACPSPRCTTASRRWASWPHLHASPRAIGWIPTLTQLGYALGLLLLAPLGDRFDRRNIIV
jgi:MFS family permease